MPMVLGTGAARLKPLCAGLCIDAQVESTLCTRLKEPDVRGALEDIVAV